jgi:ABC-2 type transport system ATP-binding protein
MGFMVAGEVVLQGSPSEVKASQPGQLIELRVSRNQQAANLLKTFLEPWRVSIFGDRLHIVFDNPEYELSNLRSHPEANQIQLYSDHAVSFSLEDAFIGTV